jgi:hypothetical protein
MPVITCKVHSVNRCFLASWARFIQSIQCLMMLELEVHALKRCQDREERWLSSTEETPEQRILKETMAFRLK